MKTKTFAVVIGVLLLGCVTACDATSTSSPDSANYSGSSTNATVPSFTVKEKSSTNLDEWSFDFTGRLALAVEYFGRKEASNVTINLTPGGTMPEPLAGSFDPKQRKQLFNVFDFTGTPETIKVQIAWAESGKQYNGFAEYELAPSK